MFNCDCLIHPFQNDPGTSQRQRVMEELLGGAAKIDARTLADLLDYFVKLAPHINYYDEKMTKDDWRPFFKRSIPFALSAVVNYPVKEVADNFSIYNNLFNKKPVPTGLQLNAHFLYYYFINRINQLHGVLAKSELPIEVYLENLIREKLRAPVIQFISYVNAAVNSYGIKRIDFSPLYENKVWNLGLNDLYSIYTTAVTGLPSDFIGIHAINDKLKSLFPVFEEVIKALSAEAARNLNLSLVHNKEQLQKKHEPHLALLFAFLNLFRYLQDDLNRYTRRHLDFFYIDILHLKPGPATPDRAFVLFEIQKQLKKHILNKGLLLKGGKDEKKQEILFALDDELAVNKTEVVDKRTLFLHNQTSHEHVYVGGVYMAPDATKVEGIKIDFTGDPPYNFPTVGSRLSKYIHPETKVNFPYPNARIGFVLASPVLLLREGTRYIDINLACILQNSQCAMAGNDIIDAARSCCNKDEENETARGNEPYPLFLDAFRLYDTMRHEINKTWVYLDELLLAEAGKQGFKPDLIEKLRESFNFINPDIKKCYCDEQKQEPQALITLVEWEMLIDEFDLDEKQTTTLSGIFPPFKLFKLSFSGEKEWIVPKPENYNLTLGALAGNLFKLTISTTLDSFVPGVSYYDDTVLKEGFTTLLPLVKIELDDRVKLLIDDQFIKDIPGAENEEEEECSCIQDADCCVLREEPTGQKKISTYHFWRNVIISDEGNDKTLIDVKVCGLRNLIVQNDDSLQDVNGPFFPFGTIPKIESSFYLGSKEIFSKNWQEIWINGEWKDRPLDFGIHYTNYHYGINFEDGSTAITDASFKIIASVLDSRNWVVDGNRRLFKDPGTVKAPFCNHPNPEWNQDIYHFTRGNFPGLPAYKPMVPDKAPLLPLNVNSYYGFLRFMLGDKDTHFGVSFQHHRFSYVLTRHMVAIADLVDPLTIEPALALLNNTLTLVNSIKAMVDNDIKPRILNIPNINNLLNTLDGLFNNVIFNVNDALAHLGNAGPINLAITDLNTITGLLGAIGSSGTILGDADTIRQLVSEINVFVFTVSANLGTVIANITEIQSKMVVNQAIKGGLPSEPYTPIFKTLNVDYTAKADINDIALIHLYPYSETYKTENLKLRPTLFPTFCDEGTLFLGLNELVPGNNLNILFQLAEATSDSESEKAEVYWYYLDSNVWKPLRNGFEVLDDATQDLTSSGIVKFALPANMTKDNTVMPKNQHWIKASVRRNSRSVSETTGIHPQAMLAIFSVTADNDMLRLEQPLSKGSITKLNTADASLKTVQQPYDTFGGKLPESEGPFYVRVSELLRHKGRAIQPWDYERLALEAFPELFKVKCISHSFALDANRYKNDFPYSPGYVTLAVIPDLYKLKAGFSFEPKVPVSILEKVETLIRKYSSPFVRFSARNPIYEKINFCIRVQLIKGKDENYYKEKLKDDLRIFLAPWAVGIYHKLSFGECIYRSEIVRFLETTTYVDFITDLRMGKKDEEPGTEIHRICPETPRSILIAGDIEVCIEKPSCIDWNNEFEGCGGKKVITCENKPEPFIDYCNQIERNRNGR